MHIWRWLAATVVLASTVACAQPARDRIEADWLRGEQVTWQRPADSPAALAALLTRGRKLLDSLGDLPQAATARAVFDTVERDAAGPVLDRYRRTRWALREAALASPALDYEQILFVRRQWPGWNHQCSHRVGEAQTPGANLCVVSGWRGEPRVRDLLAGEFAAGGIGRPDLSFDGQRIVFPYARPRRPATGYGYGEPGVRGGPCGMYDLYTVGIDGGTPAQLTDTPAAEDTEPCWLPDGRIAFASSRDGRLVQCGDWALVCGIHSVNADGSDARRITEPQEGEFYPSLLADGRILYTRWDYVMKGYNVIQQLWTVHPDGTRAQLAYGDWYAHSLGPIGLYEARQVPGTSLVMATGSAHHNTGAGPIMLVDLAQSRGALSGLTNLTPEIGYPEAVGQDERCQPASSPIPAVSNTHNATGWYAAPYPLSRTQFLVCWSPEAYNGAPTGYGLYLQDVWGNRELLYRAPDASCYAPLPVRPRPVPRVLPDRVRGVDPSTPGTLLVSDIYRGLPGVPRGSVKSLRVLRVFPKTEHTVPQRVDVGAGCGWDVRGVLGEAPVEPDGSAHLQVPAGQMLFLEAIDANGLEVRRMRNYLNLQPGEQQSCVGCHEDYATAPPSRPSLAARRAPSTLTPPPWGTDGFSYQRVVQPVLDRACVRCHDGQTDQREHSVDLRATTWRAAPAPLDADQGPQHAVTDSFLSLLKHVSYIKVGGYGGPKLPLAPYAVGSGASPLLKLLRAGHHGVTLSPDDMLAITAWIDCNAPFYGGWDEIVLPEVVARALREPSAADLAAIAARRRDLAASLPAGRRLVAYLAGGLTLTDGAEPGPRLLWLNGQGWSDDVLRGIPDVLDTQRTLAWDEAALRLAAKGLDPARRYDLVLCWWDYNAASRRQSVGAVLPDKSRRVLLPATDLPNWTRDRQRAATVTVQIPADLTGSGQANITIAREGGANVVVSEAWLTEND
ncbi:MAG: PD40 domain-containing protein [Armatimonadetes bacterium]|nr:PD40 domain-containing protein [Armatimonadota bacterium]